MEWDSSDSDGGSGEEEEEKVGPWGGAGGGEGFPLAIEGVLGGACACGLVVSDALEPGFPIIYVSRGFEGATGYTPRRCSG